MDGIDIVTNKHTSIRLLRQSNLEVQICSSYYKSREENGSNSFRGKNAAKKKFLECFLSNRLIAILSLS